MFRAKWFEPMRLAGLHRQDPLSDGWLVHCKKVGLGEQALLSLGRYLYCGVLAEKNIIADRDCMDSFCYQDNQAKRQVRTLPGGRLLWLPLRHVLYRRSPRPVPLPPHPIVLSGRSGKVMTTLARLVEPNHHRLC
jgi:hypothetical protein